MGRTINVVLGSEDEEPVDRIQWDNFYGEEEYILNSTTNTIYININGYGDVEVFKADIPKLHKALGIAMKEEWHLHD